MAQDKPGFGILTVQIKALAGALHLPDGYRIVGVDYEPRTQALILTLVSDDIPVVQDGYALPRVYLQHAVETLPGVSPEYHRITAYIEVGS